MFRKLEGVRGRGNSSVFAFRAKGFQIWRWLKERETSNKVLGMVQKQSSQNTPAAPSSFPPMNLLCRRASERAPVNGPRIHPVGA